MAEYVDKSLFEANAALNAQEFANRQILLKGDGVPVGVAPFGATYIDRTANPPKIYRQVALGTGSNWQLDSSGGGSSINGAVFITDISPQDPLKNVGQKVFSSDGRVLDAALTNTNLVNVQVLAAMGHSNYKPEVLVKGLPVNLTQDEDQSIWMGNIDIDLEDDVEVTALHEDGATHSVSIQRDLGPKITSALFSGGYPAEQTELKAGDKFQLTVESDAEMVRIEVEDFGAAEAGVYDFAATPSKVIELTIADRGDISKSLGVRIRAMNANGSFGDPFESESQGADNGLHVVMLNNTHPSGIIDAIEYPVDQLALKDNEVAQVALSAFNYDELEYLSPNGQLEITDPLLYEPLKAVNRIAGEYNVNEINIRIRLNRKANGAITDVDGVVQIAHIDPKISVIESTNRLRSGGNQGTQAQNHEISLISDQELIEAPVLAVPHGTLLGAMLNESGDKLIWTQNLRVHDEDEKGVFQFTLTTAKNLAGRIVNVLSGDATYELGGFVSRTIEVPAFAGEIDLGVNVSETAKVVARDKDNILLTYKNNLDDELKTYAITGPSGTLNVKGNLFHWTDSQAVNNNTTGLATITVEEVV